MALSRKANTTASLCFLSSIFPFRPILLALQIIIKDSLVLYNDIIFQKYNL